MKITQDLMILPRSKVETFFNNNIEAAYNVIKRTYLDFSEGKSKNPPSSFLWYDDETNSRIIGLAAYLGDEKSYPGIKWIASCPNNIDHGIQRASAVIVLNDFTTGFPIAIIEGAAISALRTALSAILGLEHLYPTKNISHLGIVGGGNLAVIFLHCLYLLGWTIGNCLVHDKNSNQVNQMKKRLPNLNNLEYSPNLNQMLKQSDVVLLTTTSAKPYIMCQDVFKSEAVILNLSLRDLAPEILLAAYNIVDEVEHVLAANTSPHLAYRLSGNKKFIAGNIMQLVSGLTKPVPEKLKIFSPMGMGILDIALANLLLTYSLNDDPCVIKEFFK